VSRPGTPDRAGTIPTRGAWPLLRLLPLVPLLAVTMVTGQCSQEPLGSVDAGPPCAYKGKTYGPGASFPSTDGCNVCSCDSDGVVRCTVRACSDAGAGDAGRLTKNCPDPLTGELGPCPDASPSYDAGEMCFDIGGQVIECRDGGSLDGRDGATVCQDSAGTIIPCVVDGGIGTCGYLGKIYHPGDLFEAADGCNSCTCTVMGRVECSARSCADAAADGATTCDYAGKPYPLGATVPSGDACSTCSCSPGGITCTMAACRDAGAPLCGLDAVYIYGDIGGRRGSQDQVTIAPSSLSPQDQATYVHTRNDVGGAAGISCNPPLPACGDMTALDVSDIMADIRDPVVQTYLALDPSKLPFVGFDTRPVDGTAFSFMRGDGHGFLVGQACGTSSGASTCVAIPAAIDKLVKDLRALDDQQLRSASCAALR